MLRHTITEVVETTKAEVFKDKPAESLINVTYKGSIDDWTANFTVFEDYSYDELFDESGIWEDSFHTIFTKEGDSEVITYLQEDDIVSCVVQVAPLTPVFSRHKDRVLLLDTMFSNTSFAWCTPFQIKRFNLVRCNLWKNSSFVPVYVKQEHSSSIIDKHGNRYTIAKYPIRFCPQDIDPELLPRRSDRLVQCRNCGSYVATSFLQKLWPFSESSVTVCPHCVEHTIHYIYNWLPYAYRHSQNVMSLDGFSHYIDKGYEKLLGLELEYELKYHTRTEYNRLVKTLETVNQQCAAGIYAILKHDSSIKRGAEVVTIPAPLWVHLRYLRVLYNMLRKDFATFNTSVGLHVNVSYTYFKDERAKQLFYDFINSEDLRDIVVDMSGRYTSSMAAFCSDIKYQDSKYYAVNPKEYYYEVRIFKSPKYWKQLVRSLEFVDVVISYCNTYETLPSTEDWIKFVLKNTLDESPLRKFYVSNYS